MNDEQKDRLHTCLSCGLMYDWGPDRRESFCAQEASGKHRFPKYVVVYNPSSSKAREWADQIDDEETIAAPSRFAPVGQAYVMRADLLVPDVIALVNGGDSMFDDLTREPIFPRPIVNPVTGLPWGSLAQARDSFSSILGITGA